MSTSAPDLIEQLLAAGVTGTAAPWPRVVDGRFVDAMVEAAHDHGVAALLARAVPHAGEPDWLAPLREGLRPHVTGEAATEMLRRAEVARVVSVLARGGVGCLLMKGAPLAYSHYSSPWMRPRVDTDLLIEPEDREASIEVMTAEGYAPGTGFSGELVTHQHTWERMDWLGLRHLFDIHTRVANPQLFARVLEFRELDSRAVAVPVLGPTARGLSAVDALLLAAVHRAAHHYGSNRLIWLYDIHLLIGGMDDGERVQLAERAIAKGIQVVTADAILAAATRFGVEMSSALRIFVESAPERAEATASFLVPGLTKVDILLHDLRALPRWRSKGRLILEHLFPPASYMRQVYAVSHPAVLPWVYTHRILSGVAKWFRRH